MLLKHSLLAAITLGSSLLVGCSSNEYNPPEKPTQLAAQAASTQYPENLQANDNLKFTSTVNNMNGDLTVTNFGSDSLTSFDLWINKSYVIHVDRLDPGMSKIFHQGDLFNKAGNTLDATPNSIKTVQIATHDGRESKLYNVQGPVVQ